MNLGLRHGLCCALFTLLLGAAPQAGRAQSAAAQNAGADAPARNFIWRISKGRSSMYLAGSIHTLNPDSYPLPDVMESAFQDSYALVEEVNLTLVDPINVRAQALRLGTYPPGESLRTELPPAIYQRVADSAQNLGLDMQRLDRLRPWLGSITVLEMQLQQAAFNPSYGLDHHFANEAQMSGKPVIGLETVRQQLEFLARLPARVQQDMLLQSLQQAGNFLVEVHTLIRTWENGDAEGMRRIMQHDFENYPRAYERLIVDRNRAWFPRLERLARSGRVYFVVVGAMHLIGPDGLLVRFRRAGYRVEQLKTGREIAR
ncbi:MAG: TraB/GumN family protein [Gammaproteobacteria bacterium]|nr:TraB/GumN family protein [Gammaproteobacteria bacterium]MDE1887155.1 TraB/GumN family protein [Gammaproteobacteria bacterium]MDE2139530.1 TraB/GumN family protein [Gammaproteobacteria bacterium]